MNTKTVNATADSAASGRQERGALYIGIDLGTSSVKLLLVAADGTIQSEASADYPVSRPHDGWSEQNPADWVEGVFAGLEALLRGADRQAVRGIAVAGQMHGLVATDAAGQVIRPAILWNDGRTCEETAYLNETVGRDTLDRCTANIAFAGFTAPKLLWMRRHEPDAFSRIAKILLPKDYVVYALTGRFSTDVSDASGTLLLDVKNRRWSAEMCRICGVDDSVLPPLHESGAPVGRLKPELCGRFGLSDVTVAAGAGDNAAAAVGTGTVGDGGCTVSLGTSGTVFVPSSRFFPSAGNALHAFCHADGGYHLMGCILSAAACNQWWMDILAADDFAAEQTGLDARRGRNAVFFLPYLTGERSPHNDVDARAAFVGLSADTDRRDMTLAVLEGVAFAMRDSVEAAVRGGAAFTNVTLCGGGAKSPLWRQIFADVLNRDVVTVKTEQGPAYGAAMLAMVACGRFPDARAAAAALVRTDSRVSPDPAAIRGYDARYAVYRTLYPALRAVYPELAALRRA